jgi:hypothetical protein
MNTFDLHSLIATTLSAQWADFEAAHPLLAGVLDQSLLVHTAATSLKNDPDFQKALADAKQNGIGQSVVTAMLPIIEQYVLGFLTKLI